MVEGSGVELHGGQPGRWTFVRVLTCGTVTTIVSGALGTPGTASSTSCATESEARQMAEEMAARARSGSMTQVTERRFTAAGSDLDSLQVAFSGSWAASWNERIGELWYRAGASRPGRPEPGPRWRVLAARWWTVQTAAQPWGPALADVAASGVWAHDAGTDVALLRVNADVAAWVQAYYGGPASPAAAELTGGLDTDTGDMYRMALGLWQPELTGPLAGLRQALVTARTMFG